MFKKILKVKLYVLAVLFGIFAAWSLVHNTSSLITAIVEGEFIGADYNTIYNLVEYFYQKVFMYMMYSLILFAVASHVCKKKRCGVPALAEVEVSDVVADESEIVIDPEVDPVDDENESITE